MVRHYVIIGVIAAAVHNNYFALRDRSAEHVGHDAALPLALG
jgi:hypothetical protein